MKLMKNLTYLFEFGKKVAIITGRSSQIVEKRAENLKIDHVYQGVSDKLEVAKEILKQVEA